MENPHILVETRINGLHFAADNSARMTFQPFRVIDFGTNQKCVCNFLLVCYSNLGPTLPVFVFVTPP